MIVSSYLLPKFPTMWVVWAASALIWTIFTGTSSLSEGCTWGAKDETCWCELDGAWFGAPWPAAALWATASAWSFSSADTLAEQSPWIFMMPLGDGIFRTQYP
jgi:hypothetical protein